MRKILLFLLLLPFDFISGQALIKPEVLPKFTVDQHIGANILRTVYQEKLRSVGYVREYHEWVLDTDFPYLQDPQFPLDPTKRIINSTASPAMQGNGYKYRRNPADDGFNTSFDDLYTSIKNKNIGINVCLTGVCPQLSYPFMMKSEYGNFVLEKMGVEYPVTVGTTQLQAQLAVPSNLSLPSSYKYYANWASSYAAKYGNTQPTVAQKAWLDSHNGDVNKVYGLNKVSYLELWNEQNKNWRKFDNTGAQTGNTGNQYFYTQYTPQQYGALASATYDGHNGTIFNHDGGTVQLGIKKFDTSTNLKVVLGGTADIQRKYFDDMIDWFDQNRTNFPVKYPFDAINMHVVNSTITASRNGIPSSYFDLGGNNTLTISGSSKAVSPERDQIKSKLRNVFTPLNVSDTYYKPIYKTLSNQGKEFWISEFAYATDNSCMGTKRVMDSFRTDRPSNYDKQEVQANWLIRDMLEFMAAGWDRSMIYWYQDQNNATFNDERNNYDSISGGQWDLSCGIIKDKYYQNSQPKKAFYYVASMKNLLTDYKFVAEVQQGCLDDPNALNNSSSLCPRVYQFESISLPTKVAWVIWYPTSDAVIRPSQSIKLGNALANGTALNPTSVAIVNLDFPSETGNTISTNTAVSGNTLTMAVSERPTFVFTNLPIQYQTNPSPVSGLNVQSQYENMIKLGWTVPSITPDKYQVWFKKLTSTELSNNTLPAFDIGISTDPTLNTGQTTINAANGGQPAFMESDYGIKLYSDEISGLENINGSNVTRSNAVISGLDPNATYAFYVVPVMWINKTTPTANPIYKSVASRNITGIIGATNSIPAKITLNSTNTDTGSSELLNNQNISFSQNVMYSNYVNGTSGWNNSYGGSIIDLGQSQKVDAVQYFRIYGQNPVNFYYYAGAMTTTPSLTDVNWKKIANPQYNIPVNFPGTGPYPRIVDTESWITFSNLNDVSGNPIPNTQFIKMETGGYQVKEVFFFKANNTTTSQSNLTLLATPVPTVTPSSIPTSTTATNVTLGFTIQNTGTLAGSSTVTYFLSNDNIYDASDLALSGATTSSTASLNPNATQAISTPISIPANTQVGVKYVIVRLANGNNVPIQLTVTAPIGGSCPITFQSFTQNTNAVSGCAANPRTYVLSFKANSTTNPSAPSNIIYAVNLPTSQPLTPLTTSALPVSAAGTAIIDYPQATGGVRTMAWTLPTQLVNGTVYTCQFSFCYVDASTAPTNTPKATYTNSTCTPNPQEIFLGASNPCTNDVTLPVISGCPANISLSAAGVATWTAPTPTDNCAVTSFTSNYTSGSSFPVGVTTVTYTAKDAANNTATCSFTVTVSNTTCVPARLPINTAAFTFSVAPSGLSTSLLTDGQSTITSPPSGNVPNLSGSGWVGAWSNVLGSTELTLDGRYTITDIYAYDGNGTTEYAGNLKVNISYKKVGASVYETLTKDIALTGYNVWSSQTNLGWNDVKYLKFTTQNDASNVNEIVIFGCKTGAARLSVNEDTPTETLFTIYPNPTNDKLTVEYSLTKDSEINFGIMDMTGKTLQNRTIEGKAGTHSFVMDVSKIIEGSYILRGIADDKSQAKKFVIVR
jgi:hypothetical protein